MSLNSEKRMVIFISGGGSNAIRIMERFRDVKKSIRVVLLASSRPDSPALDFAKKEGIPTALVTKADFSNSNFWLEKLKALNPDLIVLAGFLWKVPEPIVRAFENKIVNIHPALLPKYGGKGMYGIHVHTAVIKAGEKESGLTIHLVNENYDEGSILFQEKVPVLLGDTPEQLAERILQREWANYPEIIERYLVEQD